MSAFKHECNGKEEGAPKKTSEARCKCCDGFEPSCECSCHDEEK
jgi:hypothetical protein